jgi:uncharacterized UPF0160 family protein
MKILTHNGRFHADDIFAVATLLLLNPGAEVVRSRDPEQIKTADIVVDTGFIYDPSLKRFDHHQPEGAGKRGNGIPYASFGLVWKEFGPELAGVEGGVIVDEKLGIPIDAHDNGFSLTEPKFPEIKEYTISDFFYSYLDVDEVNEENLYKAFMSGVEIAKNILTREIIIAKKEVADMVLMRKILAESPDKRIVVIDKDMDWYRTLVREPETLYVVYPRKEGNWGAKAVPKAMWSFEAKKPFPRAWAGKAGEELVQITGVPDAVFCHRECFVCSAKSKEGVIELARKALNA